MKHLPAVVAGGLAIWVAGFASGATPVVHYPSPGQLVVYSEYEYPMTTGDEMAADHHSNYHICRANGTSVMTVKNERDYLSKAPAVVSLAPGHYVVTANSVEGTVSVPVVIQAGQTTRVHLDGSKPPRIASQGESVVHLADGEIVGWIAVR